MTMETSPSIENLSAALGKFQAETHGVVRDATNPFLKNRYATLEAVIETARPALAKAGLAFLQAPSGISGQYTELITMLMHGASGEWIRFSTIMPIPKADPQGVGSAITYACRYALMAMLGLPPLDDDAEATKPQQNAQQTQQTLPSGLNRDVEQLGAIPLSKPQATQALQSLAQPKGIEAITGEQSRSKQIYVANAINLIQEIGNASKLLARMKKERQIVWPQYGIDPLDEDGQKLVKAYKERMAELEKADEKEPAE
jgi:hypothetical protein